MSLLFKSRQNNVELGSGWAGWLCSPKLARCMSHWGQIIFCPCKLDALRISTSPPSFQHWGGQWCFPEHKDVLIVIGFDWYDAKSEVQAFNSIYLFIYLQGTKTIPTWINVCVFHMCLSLSSFEGSHSISSACSVFGDTPSPAWASQSKTGRRHVQNWELNCCLDLKWLARQQRRRHCSVG